MSEVRERWLPGAVEYERSLLSAEQRERLATVTAEAGVALEAALEESLVDQALKGRYLVDAEALAVIVQQGYAARVTEAIAQAEQPVVERWSAYILQRVPERDREVLLAIGLGALSLLAAADPNSAARSVAGRHDDVSSFIAYGVDDVGYLGKPPRQQDDPNYRHPGVRRCTWTSWYVPGAWHVMCHRERCLSERYWALFEVERELLSWSIPYREAVLAAVASVREVTVEARITADAQYSGERKLSSRQRTELEHEQDRRLRRAMFAIRRANRSYDLPEAVLQEWKRCRKELTRGFVSLEGIVWSAKLYGPGALLVLDARQYGAPATDRLYHERVHAELHDIGSVPPKGFRMHP